jgi:hypothetical protein
VRERGGEQSTLSLSTFSRSLLPSDV